MKYKNILVTVLISHCRFINKFVFFCDTQIRQTRFTRSAKISSPRLITPSWSVARIHPNSGRSPNRLMSSG